MAGMNQISKLWQRLSSQVNGLSLRERLIMFGMINTLMVIVLFSLAIEPLYKEVSDLKSEAGEIDTNIAIKESDLKILKIEYSVDPNLGVQENIDALRQQIDEKDDVIKSKTSELIAAEDMVHLLSDLVAKQKGVELISLENIAVTPLMWVEEEPDSNTEAGEEAPEPEQLDMSDGDAIYAATLNAVLNGQPADGEESEFEAETLRSVDDILLYRHGVRIKLEGDYWSVLDYIRMVESMKWNFFWHSIDYQVLEHPNATVVLELHTLGYEQGWLGV